MQKKTTGGTMPNKPRSIEERYATRKPLTEDEEEALSIYKESGTEGWVGPVTLRTVRGLMDKGYFATTGITDLGRMYLELEG